MQWADLFLHAAVSEGFCNAVMEAQAMQLPVVTSDADGLRENVADGVTGFVVPRRDPAALAANMQVLINDPFLRTQMGAAGRERVQSCFDIRDQAERFLDLYQRVLDQPAREAV
jgi:colanic acid/amylovoran biosynthesis glycosyltransferase